MEENQIVFEIDEHNEKLYAFDQVAPENTSQEAIFREVGIKITDNFIQGY